MKATKCFKFHCICYPFHFTELKIETQSELCVYMYTNIRYRQMVNFQDLLVDPSSKVVSFITWKIASIRNLIHIVLCSKTFELLKKLQSRNPYR